MSITIPPEAIERVRSIFREANNACTKQLSIGPNNWETHLDMALISQLNNYSAPLEVGKGLFINVQTHFLGGRRMYYSWEIADIGVLVMFRVHGQLVRTKLALLQSKRLYAVESKYSDEARLDHYEMGFARLYQESEDYRADLLHRTYSFDYSSRYSALKKADEQEKAIAAYEQERGLQVHYLFYNPCLLPWTVEVPRFEPLTIERYEVGARVISSSRLRSALASLSPGSSPSVGDVANSPAESDGEPTLGRSLEDFVADRLIGCHEGYRTETFEDETLSQVFFYRSGPIAAAIAITIDLPED